MKLAITGASGPFGRGVAEALLQQGGHDLTLLSRSPAKLNELAERGATVRAADFDQPETLAAAYAGIDRLLLISTDAVGGKRLAQHRAAIDAARSAGVREVVYTSFVGVCAGNPAVSAQEHLVTEGLLRDSGMAWTFLRDSQYAEAIALFAAPGALMTGQWLAAACEGRIALVSRQDCIACAAAVLGAADARHAHQAYDITGPELLSYRDCTALIAEFGGKPVQYQPCSDEEKLAFFDAIGVPRRIEGDGPIPGPIPWPSEEMVSFERAIREGWMAVQSNTVERLTGRPPLSLRQVFEQHAQVLRPAESS